MTLDFEKKSLTTLERPRGKGPLHPFWVFSNQVEVKKYFKDDTNQWILLKTPTRTGSHQQLGITEKHPLVAIRLYDKRLCQAIKTNTQGEVYLDSKALVESVTELFLSLELQKIQILGLTCPQKESYRLCHGDADGFPGLVIDVYGDLLVIQSATASSDSFLPLAVEALKNAFPGKSLFERSSGQIRAMEKLPERTRLISGITPNLWRAGCGGIDLSFTPFKCQKTGLFLDQRLNLKAIRELARRLECKSVLDICSYVGAWSVALALEGAKGFDLIDQDAHALTLAQSNIKAAQSEAQIVSHHGDLFEALSVLSPTHAKSFCAVVADPPAFAKSPSHVSKALIAYGRLSKKASALVKPGGLFVMCSCSRSVSATDFEKVVTQNLHEPETWKLLHVGRESPDHTVNAAMPNAHYLKCFIFQKYLN